MCELRQCSFTAPKKFLFYSISGHKTIIFHKKKAKFHSKWLTPLERYDRYNLFSLVLGCQHILIWALDFFQRSGQHMVPISCKTYYIKKIIWGIVSVCKQLKSEKIFFFKQRKSVIISAETSTLISILNFVDCPAS